MKKSLFVIEDNRTEGMLFRLALSSIQEIEITHFPGGLVLLEALKTSNPDIILADLMLPDIDGLDLIAQIRKTSPKSRIIVVSAQTDIAAVAKVQELGVYNYLVKSEACLAYLQAVISDLLLLISNK